MVVGVDEQLKVPPKLIVIGVVVAFDGGVFDGPVHPLDLTIGPRMVWLGQPVFDPMFGADAIEQMACKLCCWSVAIAWRVTELDTIVGQDDVQSIGEGVDQVAQELAGDHPGSLRLQPGEDEFGRAVDAHEQVEFAFFGPDLSRKSPYGSMWT